jgi:hypothetical protein
MKREHSKLMQGAAAAVLTLSALTLQAPPASAFIGDDDPQFCAGAKAQDVFEGYLSALLGDDGNMNFRPGSNGSYDPGFLSDHPDRNTSRLPRANPHADHCFGAGGPKRAPAMAGGAYYDPRGGYPTIVDKSQTFNGKFDYERCNYVPPDLPSAPPRTAPGFLPPKQRDMFSQQMADQMGTPAYRVNDDGTKTLHLPVLDNKPSGSCGGGGGGGGSCPQSAASAAAGAGADAAKGAGRPGMFRRAAGAVGNAAGNVARGPVGKLAGAGAAAADLTSLGAGAVEEFMNPAPKKGAFLDACLNCLPVSPDTLKSIADDYAKSRMNETPDDVMCRILN